MKFSQALIFLSGLALTAQATALPNDLNDRSALEEPSVDEPVYDEPLTDIFGLDKRACGSPMCGGAVAKRDANCPLSCMTRQCVRYSCRTGKDMICGKNKKSCARGTFYFPYDPELNLGFV
ncbi:hypothetical protein CkaCkLH20_03634 [Colletotrichum karsti]|uniref:Uncharacterized protein n=1 Tax=Colletotrichum karsti TaxID=1095194 RepID=A0A9P6I9J4_9PEZI|nr:uncharacterized protein CkaCkLH20_03634 [Colletotrichum karsti]KAF9878734.1 hypothetical protein CkaCkLH20_03634 [Colletotrichum karsti]